MGRGRPSARLRVEPLEDRLCPSGGHLLVASFATHEVPRYDDSTGAFVDEFVARHSGRLIQPYGVVFGPHDNDLYVTSGQFYNGVGQSSGVLRYDGETGEFVEVFADGNHLASPRGLIFGPDDDLFVSDFNGPAGGRVVRFDGQTGEFRGEFVPTGSGGLGRSLGLLFGPDANGDGNMDLYVASAEPNNILHYDGITGALIGAFVSGDSGLLDRPNGLTFGPDGNLYAANWASGKGHTAVLRFQGPTGPSPGAPLPAAGNVGADFVPPGGGGLQAPFGVLFGPDGNGDGRQDLYVTSCEVVNNGSAKPKLNTSTVRRYDGTTGAFIDTFVSADSGGLRDPSLMTFTETDSVTLAYRPRMSLSGVASAEGTRGQTTTPYLPVALLSDAASQPVTLSFATLDGNATIKDNDNVPLTGTLSFNPGETSKTTTIEKLIEDDKKEADEVFYLDLFELSANALFDKCHGIGMILNDDCAGQTFL